MVQELGQWIFSSYVVDMLFIVKHNMGKVTERRLMIVGTTCTVTMGVPYLLYAIVGYVSIGNAALFLDLFINREELPGSTDALMKICRLMVIVVCIIAYQVRFIAVKTQVFG